MLRRQIDLIHLFQHHYVFEDALLGFLAVQIQHRNVYNDVV